jgi:hypothetical protein
MKLLWLLALTGILAACDRSLKLGDHGLGNGSPGMYDAGQGTCPATCSTPPGTLLTFASDNALEQGLIGVWRICDGAYAMFAGAPSDTIGVELTPPVRSDAGTVRSFMYLLTQGPAGPVRGAGFDYQLTYEISDGVLYCHATSGGYGMSIQYSPCPREWQLEGPAGKGIIVPF